jgi:SAM-dependent methyltransferase
MQKSLYENLRFLICPLCSSSLLSTAGYWRCSNDDCRYSSGFATIGNQPILVDFSNTILDREKLLCSSGATQIERPSGNARYWIKDRFLRRDAVTIAQNNASDMVARLKQHSKQPTLLIIGGGSVGIGSEVFLEDKDLNVISFDIYVSATTQFLADGHRIPIADCSIDGVWVQYVLEHVLNPWQVVAEIYRVLCSDGLVYSETPFLQQVHEGPYDFTRFTHSGHRWLFRQFEEINSGIGMGMGVQQMWSIEHLIRGISRSERVGQGAKLIASYFLLLLERLIPLPYRYDSASSFFFLGRKSQTLLTPREMINYYRGAKQLA